MAHRPFSGSAASRRALSARTIAPALTSVESARIPPPSSTAPPQSKLHTQPNKLRVQYFACRPPLFKMTSGYYVRRGPDATCKMPDYLVANDGRLGKSGTRGEKLEGYARRFQRA